MVPLALSTVMVFEPPTLNPAPLMFTPVPVEELPKAIDPTVALPEATVVIPLTELTIILGLLAPFGLLFVALSIVTLPGAVIESSPLPAVKKPIGQRMLDPGEIA